MPGMTYRPSPKQAWLLKSFLPYQLRWVLDDARIALCLKGRQLGFTDATAAWMILRALYEHAPVLFISASQDVANEIIGVVQDHCAVLEALGERCATQFAVANSSTLRWASGGRIVALSSSPRTGRGFHGHMVLDEFAAHQAPDAIWAAAAPMATRGGWKIRVISTPNGAQGTFYDWCSSPPKGWSFHRVSLDDAVRDGLPVDRRSLMELVGGDERVFNEAYQCSFLDGNLQYLETELVRASMDKDLPAWPSWEYPHWVDRAPWETYAGLDVGRHHDRTALVVVRTMRGVAYVEHVATWKRAAFREQKAMIAKLRAKYAWGKLCVDKSGLGEQLAEELVEIYGSEVLPVAFTNPEKEGLATRVRRWLVNGQLRLPRDGTGDVLAREMVALRRKVTEAGAYQFEIPRTKEGHGDVFWGLALALKGAGEPASDHRLGTQPVTG